MTTTTSTETPAARLATATEARHGCPEFAATWAAVAVEARAMATAARTIGARNARALERRAEKCEALAAKMSTAVRH